MKQGRAALALTMGDPAGIGPEIALKAWLARKERNIPPFFILADPQQFAIEVKRLGAKITISTIDDPLAAAEVFPHSLPILPIPLAQQAKAGQPDPLNAQAIITAIKSAFDLVRQGKAKAMVTNPIAKRVLHEAGFAHPGHTEFLAELDGGAVPVMMLACHGLRVVPASIHIPLREVASSLTREGLLAQGRILANSLKQDFGIVNPRIAVAGLNPHAGEGGSMGDEEKLIIAPAIAALQAEGIAASGPFPADTLFHPAARDNYDVVFCMYHDQALIPLKMLDFAGGVNITLGLSVVRTSPDHGTAFNIAGQAIADPSSLIAALIMANAMADRRGQ
jgi:4-hydroxythreonine-4-phosphate dehydrogenase